MFSLSLALYFFFIYYYCSEAYSVYVLDQNMCLLKLYHVIFPPVVFLLHRLMHVNTATHSTLISVSTSTSVTYEETESVQ